MNETEKVKKLTKILQKRNLLEDELVIKHNKNLAKRLKKFIKCNQDIAKFQD